MTQSTNSTSAAAFKITIVPQGQTKASRHRTASEIHAKLLELGISKDDVSLARSRSDAQNFGDIIVAILSTTSFGTLAYGIHRYCIKKGDRVEITTPAGAVVLTGTAAEKASIEKIVKELAKLEKSVP